MFGVKLLKNGTAIKQLPQNTFQKCNQLLTDCLSQNAPSLQTLKNLDKISNELCAAVDPLTVCTRLHYNREIQNESMDAIQSLQSFMDDLNNNPIIYRLLQQMKNNNALYASFNAEEKEIIDCSIRQLELSSAPHLSDELRGGVQQLLSEIFTTEYQFLDDCHKIEESTIEPQQLPNAAPTVTPSDESIPEASMDISVDSTSFHVAMRNWTSEVKRREIFYKFYSGYQSRLDSLQKLREDRHALAQALGFPSFAEMKAQTSSLQNISNVESYLMEMADSIKDDCATQCQSLIQLKAQCSDDIQNTALYAWDLTLVKRLQSLQRESRLPQLKTFDELIGSYLTIENAFQTLQRLVDMCFDLELQKSDLNDTESWVDSESTDRIIKCELRNPHKNEHIGTLYLDVFERPGKYEEAITYPIQCQHKQSASGRQYPIVVLCLNWSHSNANVTHSQLGRQLLHEFGHALHYLLSDTEYQTLSGARGDCYEYLELPSTLMEQFAFDPYFLRYSIMDDSPQLSELKLGNDWNAFQSLLQSVKIPTYESVHSMEQISHSLFDISLFGDDAKQTQSINQLFAESYAPLMRMFGGSDNDSDGGSDSDDELRLSYLMRSSRYFHFVDYPATYYSYLLADNFAATAWKHTFGSHSTMDTVMDYKQYRNHMRIYGKSLNDTIFAVGSSRNPAQCLANFSQTTIASL